MYTFVLAAMLWFLNVAGICDGQRAPCYECELFKQQHPESKPYEQIRSHCTNPCDCPTPTESIECPVGIHLITDGCGCCSICARQQGEQCDAINLCDRQRGLVCEYASDTVIKGTCRALKGAPCRVGDQNSTYPDGSSFALDCRTQCTCQNGTYGCVSLCEQEQIRPSAGGCANPRLVHLPGRCCAEWMCDAHVPLTDNDLVQSSSEVDDPPSVKCNRLSTDWSPCSSSCGVGVSLRLSNDNEACQLVNETRLCKLRPCDQQSDPSNRMDADTQLYHHIRMSHLCRATIQGGHPEKFEYQNCTSMRRYRMKFCGSCGRRSCCVPQYTTTIQAQFECLVSSSDSPSSPSSLITYPVMSILKCVCPTECEEQVLKEQLLESSSGTRESKELILSTIDVPELIRKHRLKRRMFNLAAP